jgi:hypothetical protein
MAEVALLPRPGAPEVTGQKHGTVVIDGARVTYSSDWQRRSEDTGVRVATRVWAKR